MSDLDKQYLKFGEEFETKFLTQDQNENRSIEQTLDIGWQLLAGLPESELYRIDNKYIEKYLHKGA